MRKFVKGFNFDKTLVWQRQSDNCWCFKFLFWPLGQHTTISRGPVWWPGVWRSSHKACGMDDIKACCVPHTKACGVLDIKADDLSQLFTTSEQFWLSKQGNGPLRRGFRAAINPFKMQLDLEECDRPGSTVHIWSSRFRPSFPNSWCLFSSSSPVTAEDGILDWKSHTGQSHGQWFRSEAEIQFDFLFWMEVPWIKHAHCSHTSPHQSQWSGSNFHPFNK